MKRRVRHLGRAVAAHPFWSAIGALASVAGVIVPLVIGSTAPSPASTTTRDRGCLAPSDPAPDPSPAAKS